MKTVLVVEDERMTQRYYLSGLRGLVDWRVIVAESAMEAFRILEERSVQVIVTDLDMPRVSGLELIQAASAWYPDIPILVVSGVQDPILLDRALEAGALRIHAKPIRLSWLMDEIRGLGDRPPDGRTEGVSLGSMLQMLQWERSHATLTVRSGEDLGRLYVRAGELIQGSHRGVRGLKGVFSILSFAHPRVEFIRSCRVDPAIEMPLTEVLLEHSSQLDHARAGLEPEASAPTTPRTSPDPWGPA